MMKNIVIFGAPGSGKGTQSDLMIEKYGLEHISTGDVLRNEIKKGTELGMTAKGLIDNGQLIPDDLMVSILARVYDGFGTAHKGVIFDGFPRTIPQAEALKKMKRPSKNVSWFITRRPSRSSSGTRKRACTSISTDWAVWTESLRISVR